MKKKTITAFGVSLVALFAGAAVAGAGDLPKDGATKSFNHGHKAERHKGGKSRIFGLYDIDKDGKITAAEVDSVSKQRFEILSGGDKVVTAEQFAKARAAKQAGNVKDGRATPGHNRADKHFAQMDWNADGVVSREEFVISNRQRFNRLDHAGKGEIACPPMAEKSEAKQGRRDKGRQFGAFCAQSDLNKDGKVTRAEFDAASAQRFAQHGKDDGISKGGFASMDAERRAAYQQKLFAGLDSNKDGTLSLVEYQAKSKALFTRLDVDKDDTLTKDEIRGGKYRGGKGQHHRKMAD